MVREIYLLKTSIVLLDEMIDQQAQTSLSLEPTSFKIPFSNFKPYINKYNLEEWQTSWNNSIGNKLLEIKQTISDYQSVVRNIKKEEDYQSVVQNIRREVILALLRLGHTRVTHLYLVKSNHNVLVATHKSLYVTSIWSVATLHK